MGYLQHKKYNTSIFEHIIGILAPHRCVCCEIEGAVLCKICQNHLPVVDNETVAVALQKLSRLSQSQKSIQELYVVCLYIDLPKKLIASLKFERNRAAGGLMAELLANKIGSGADYLVTHVPTAPRRMRVRGYDQAEVIATHLARQLRIDHKTLLWRKTTARQVGSSRLARLSQSHGEFGVQGNAANQDILLVDDVLTTGATLAAAADELYNAGAKSVSAAVFALA